VSLADEILKAEKDAASKLGEIERMKKLAEAHPDIRKYVGRWEKAVFCSKSVNTKVSDYDLRHNCGCCNDSPLEVWPYLETPLGKVYSDPPMFFVGERDPMTYGDHPKPGWKGLLRAADIPEALIDRISLHFRQQQEAARAYADSLYSSSGDEAPVEDDDSDV
jgi:hypothetical protein